MMIIWIMLLSILILIIAGVGPELLKLYHGPDYYRWEILPGEALPVWRLQHINHNGWKRWRLCVHIINLKTGKTQWQPATAFYAKDPYDASAYGWQDSGWRQVNDVWSRDEPPVFTQEISFVGEDAANLHARRQKETVKPHYRSRAPHVA